jgi:ribosomal protein L29
MTKIEIKNRLSEAKAELLKYKTESDSKKLSTNGSFGKLEIGREHV